MYIKQDKLVIRDALETDSNLLADWWNDGRVMEHAGFPNGLGITAEQVNIQLQSNEKERRLIMEENGIPIGEMCYRNKGKNIAEIGIKICDFSRQNLGLGKIFLSMLLKELFTMGYVMIVLDTDIENKRAQHVYEQLGFKRVRVNDNCWTDQLGVKRSSVDYELKQANFISYLDDQKKQNVNALQPWEALMKRIVWLQLGHIENKKILDFGSGLGITANYLAADNEVIAIEPSEDSVDQRWRDHKYQQLVGSTEKLKQFEDETFDIIICHNVLEYALDREEIVKEFARILKPNGKISIVKHNRAGRVMQMVVLLNDFESAYSLLEGKDGTASKYGTIHYYEDTDVESWCNKLKIVKTLGMRTFWDMQQNQEIHKDKGWQDKMIAMEMKVSNIEEYKNIAFFHHLIIEKIDCTKEEK